MWGAKCQTLVPATTAGLRRMNYIQKLRLRVVTGLRSTNLLAMKDFGSSTVVCKILSDRRFDLSEGLSSTL